MSPVDSSTSDHERRTVLVTGATGTQGGAVASELLADDAFDVKVLTRDPSQDSAKVLQRKGAHVFQGDLADRDRLEEIFDGVDAVFGVTNFWEHGYEDEIEHGINLAEAANAADVEHLVFSSVGGAERDTGIVHFDSKFEIEQRIDELGVPSTILRPVFFMQNFEDMSDGILEGTLAMALEPGVSLQMLDVENLGSVVAKIAADPEPHVGEAYELASDELTLQASAIRFAAVTGKPVQAQHLSIADVRDAMGEEYAVMFEWFNEAGYEANLTALRSRFSVGFTRLETYLRREGWEKRGS